MDSKRLIPPFLRPPGVLGLELVDFNLEFISLISNQSKLDFISE